MIRSFLSVVLLAIFTTMASSQVLEPVKWSFSQEKISDTEFFLVFTANMKKEWNVYSQYTSDDGPVPTELVFESQNGVEIIGKSEESGHKKEGFDKLFETNVIKFLSDEPFVIKQKVKLTGNKGEVSGYLTYMTCNDERCLPPTDVDFSFSLSTSTKGDAPKPDPEENHQPEQEKEDFPDQDSELKVDMDQAINVDMPDGDEPIKINFSGSDETTKEDQPSDNILDPVKWSFTREKISEEEYLLRFKADIQDEWTVYSQYTEDNGPIPTSINYEEKKGFILIGEGEESGHRKEAFDEIFGVDVIKFLSDEPYIITQKVKVEDPSALLTGYLSYMTCDDTKCIPADIDFSFNFSENTADAALASSGTTIEGNVIDQFIPSIASTYKDPISECEEGTEESTSFLWTFIFGFVGGFLALLTPCVFPMIPITVSFFTKDTKRKGWVNGMIYGASIIFIYVLIGLLITILLGPEALNRLSTNWIANTLFFVVFIAFAFSFFGFYEITLPSSWSTKSDRMADKGGLIGIFFMAFTLALVSFSCTGPIIGSALVQAATEGEYVGPFLVMLGFSTALALPFGLFAAFPAWLNTLPRSGSWMNSVKVVLGFLELALALKFLSIADMTNHWGVLKYELFMGLWILVFLAMALYLFGFIKFPHDSPIKKLSIPRIGFGLLSLAIVVYLATGFMIKEKTNTYNALPLMSGLAPPAHYNYFLPAEDLDADLKAKYPSYSKCANNIDCFKDYNEGLAYAKESNKPMILDFTGYGCVNCRKTEEHIWVDDDVRKKLDQDLVLVSLYVDDDTKLDQTLISKSRGKKIRNVGNKWADFQIVNFEQNSQPLYIIVSPDEKVITAPRPYKEGVDEYNAFLDCGLNSYAQMDTN